MMKASLLSLLVVLLLGLLSAPAPVDATCGMRVRKSYDRLTVDEKRLYRRALQKAMDAGHYIKFVEMHTEKLSEMEAHRVCMFTYWHRYFLLGFENMLRSLGPEFARITVPYWDQMQQNARAMTGACSSVEGCAPMIRDWGGSTNGTLDKSVMINGVTVSGYICAKGTPLDRFSQASSATGSNCAGCLPRDNLKTKVFPAMANYASVFRQLFTAKDFVTTGKTVEDGMHNAIHAALGSTMGTFQSPADPIFWSHHAYVDLLLTIFLKCRAGLGKLSNAEKQDNPYTFVQCPHRQDAGFFTATSTVTMRNGENGNNPVQTNTQDSPLYEFFKDIPSQYAALSDVTALGTNRYTYQIGGLVGQMGVYCDKAPSGQRRLKEEEEASFTSESTTTRVGCRSELDTSKDTPASSSDGKSAAAPAQTNEDSVFQVDTSYDNDPDALKVQAWMKNVQSQLAKLPVDKSREPVAHPEVVEMERMVCMFYDQCRGGVTDYSDEFKRAFGVTTLPPCKVIVDEIKDSECKQIRLPNWKETMEKYFPCTVPAYGTSTSSESPSGSSFGDQ